MTAVCLCVCVCVPCIVMLAFVACYFCSNTFKLCNRAVSLARWRYTKRAIGWQSIIVWLCNRRTKGEGNVFGVHACVSVYNVCVLNIQTFQYYFYMGRFVCLSVCVLVSVCVFLPSPNCLPCRECVMWYFLCVVPLVINWQTYSHKLKAAFIHCSPLHMHNTVCKNQIVLSGRHNKTITSLAEDAYCPWRQENEPSNRISISMLSLSVSDVRWLWELVLFL